jgi:hypothetical protein
LLGRLGALHLTRKEAGQDKTTVVVEIGVIDPLDKIKAITLHCLPASAVKGDAAAIRSLSNQPGCRSIKLTLEKQLASGDLTLDTKDAATELLLQAEYVHGSGKKVQTKVHRQAAEPADSVVKVPEPGGTKGPAPEVAGPGPTYSYSQSTGKLTLKDQLVGVGYSGKGAAKNDSAKQAEKDGPIPIGDYVFTGYRNDPKLGGKVMGLLPVAGGNYFNRFPRERFAIIAETDNPPSGCFIVVSREVLDKLNTAPHTRLRVAK